MSTPHQRGAVREFYARPHVAVFFWSAMLGRLSYATVGFALILQVQRATGSYSCAGAAAVTYGLTAALLAPLRARLVDRWGRRRALPLMAGCTALLLILIAVLGEHFGGEATFALIALSGLVGCGLPPLGPVTRGVWADSASGDVELRAAYSLDTVAEEGLFTAGPLLVGVVVAVADARSALLLTAVLMLVGTGAMVRSPLMLEPAAVSDVDDTALPIGAPAPSLLARPAFVSLLLVLFGVGAGPGGVELAAIAVARGSAAASTGAVLAALNLGSAAGGMAYGARAWRSDASTHLVVLCGLLAAGIGGLAVLSGSAALLVFGVAAFLVGLCISPLLIADYTSADALSDRSTRTQASTMVSTVNNLGGSIGTAATGLLLDSGSPARALLAGALALAGTAVVAAVHRGYVRARSIAGPRDSHQIPLQSKAPGGQPWMATSPGSANKELTEQ